MFKILSEAREARCFSQQQAANCFKFWAQPAHQGRTPRGAACVGTGVGGAGDGAGRTGGGVGGGRGDGRGGDECGGGEGGGGEICARVGVGARARARVRVSVRVGGEGGR